MMAELTRWVLRNRRTVLVSWLLLTVAGAIAVTPATGAMTQDFGALPGRPGYETNQQILRSYGNGSAGDPVVLTVTVPPGQTIDIPRVRTEWAAAVTAASAAAGETRLVSYPSTDDRRLVSADGRTTIALLYPPAADAFPPYAQALPKITAALADRRVGGAQVMLTGTDALFVQAGDADGPSLLAEVTIAALGALVVLAVVFGSALAVLPLITAIVAILLTFLAVWGLTAVGEVSFVVQFLVGLIGLGVAIDYALLVTTRWRAERTAGADNDTAILQSMRTAGHAVVVSGVTVAVALTALVLLPVPFLRSMGYGGLLISLCSVLVATTLLPALLATVGPRLDKRRLHRRRRARPATRPSGHRPIVGPGHSPTASVPPGGGWAGWGRLVTRRPAFFAITALLILAALIAPVAGLRLAAPSAASMASSGPAREGLDDLARSGLGVGALTPVYLLVDGDPAAAVSRAAAVPGVQAVVAPRDQAWQRGGHALVVVLPHDQASSAPGEQTLNRLEEALTGMSGVRLGGSPVQGRDFVDAVYDDAPLVLALIAVVTLALLIRAFRSVLLAVKAVALNALSVAAAFGLVVLGWQNGHLAGLIWGIDPTGALTQWVPVMVFAFLFGLSMDYEVFLLARIREAHDQGLSNRDAVVAGLSHTGRLVTSAAIILFLAFVSLAATPGTEVKIFATALGLGILLDATVVRAMLVPALVILFGRWNWWLPTRPPWLPRLSKLHTPTGRTPCRTASGPSDPG